MIFMPKLSKHFYFILAFCCLIFSNTAKATGNYQVEVIVFKHVYGQTGNNPTLIDKVPSFASTWAVPKSLLSSYAGKITAASQYQILSYNSWGQKSAPFKSSAAKEYNQNGLNGYVKVFANQLLFAEIKLTLDGHFMSERRRLKLDELHYFDNAGIGVLMQVSRL